MTLEIRKIGEVAATHGVKAILYGPAGAGKTFSISTIPGPESVLVLSAEAGLLSIREQAADVDVVVIDSVDRLREAYEYLATGGHTYRTVVLDSLSEIAEQVLDAEKGRTKDGRQAYGELQTVMMRLIKSFRDLPGLNALFLCKQERVQDANGLILYGPGMPGAKLAQQIPYLTDLLFALRVRTEEEGSINRAFQTASDEQYYCKDRSGKLDTFEPPDWSTIFNKIDGGNNHE